jgi:ketosteroid isomerase-like protein
VPNACLSLLPNTRTRSATWQPAAFVFLMSDPLTVGHRDRFVDLVAKRQLPVKEEVVQFEPQEFIADENQVVVLGHYAWRVRSTGRKYESDWAHVFTVRGGRIVRFREYTDTAAATAAYRRS